MTATEYQEALTSLGLTKAEAARLLQVNVRTSRRWALGEREIPAAVEVLLRLWHADPHALERTREAGGRDEL